VRLPDVRLPDVRLPDVRLPDVRVLTDRPGDTLSRLRELARTPTVPRR
jgi:hypothetical protein